MAEQTSKRSQHNSPSKEIQSLSSGHTALIASDVWGVRCRNTTAMNTNCQKRKQTRFLGLTTSTTFSPNAPKPFIFQSQIQTRSHMFNKAYPLPKSIHRHSACKKSPNLLFHEIPERRLLYIWSLLYRSIRGLGASRQQYGESRGYVTSQGGNRRL